MTADFVDVLTAVLGHFIWQAALIAGALWLVLRGETRPRVRYVYACSALGSMLAAAMLSFGVLYAERSACASLPVPRISLSAAPSWKLLAAPYVLLAWGVGSTTILFRLAFGMMRLRWLLRRAERRVPQLWQRRMAELRALLGIARPVGLAVSSHVRAPLVVGYLRPVVLVPVAFLTDLPAHVVEAILLHELWHVRRHDWLVNLFQVVVETVFFYHPCVYWVSRMIRESREECCDESAVASFGDALAYARALVSLEGFRSESAALGLSASGGTLMSRVRRIACPVESRASSRGLGAAALVVACVLALGAMPALACVSASPVAKRVEGAWLPEGVSRWTPQLQRAARRHGIEPDLLAIVTMVESAGNPEVESPQGALGLTQVMPQTAQRIAEERGISGHRSERLKEPEYNLDFGAYYFAQQLRAFGSVELAAAAYNAGPEAVRAHLSEGKALTEETEHYKQRVAQLWAERRGEASRQR